MDAVRAALAARREDGGGTAAGLAADVAQAVRPSLRRVINATGVVIHTNLGRAPLADEAIAALLAAAGYCTLEWEPASGSRGSRHDHVVEHLGALTGAPAACVANTCAGAVLLALVALASGGEVIVSRGQLVEIGGGFRIPEILAASGCRLVEVGTTNRTRLSDYANAIGPDTAAILRVHPSNFRVVGFTEEVEIAELGRLAREANVALIDDLGSGAFAEGVAIEGEPTVGESVRAGADIVAFSGDKLLGGPQAGILVGTADAIGKAAGHPLMRALRPDKLTLAALQATLALHREPALARERIPVLRALTASPEHLRARAEVLARAIGGEVVPAVGRVGGGALPTTELPGFAAALPSDEALALRLREQEPSVATRVADGRLLFDVRCLSDTDLAEIPALVERARR